MQSRLALLTLTVALVAAPENLLAIGRTRYVETTASRGSFPLVGPRGASPIYVDAADWPGVVRAVSQKIAVHTADSAKPVTYLGPPGSFRN
jgi:hypothetical protein